MILSGDRRVFAPAAGLLVIGDPHVSSRRPGRRKDAAWPEPILRKLEVCVKIANERDLLPVILGDLFERPVEPDVALTSRLIRILKSFRHRPIANVGNHDVGHTRLSDGDSLAMLALGDVLDAAALSGPAGAVAIGGGRWGLGFTPFGQAIPADVRGAIPDADRVAWFTHHDLAFGQGYPGAVPPRAIEGAALAVNGHVHKAERPLRAGSTLWHNPGALARTSVDLLDHRPAAWILSPDGTLSPVPLPFEADVFDLTGRLVSAAGAGAVAADLESAFVSLLKAESATEIGRSGDGAVLRDEIEAKFQAEGTGEDVRAVVRSLLAEAVERRAGR